MAARDLESHGFFLTPLLQPGFDVLDVGCGPATITTGIADMVFPGRVIALDESPDQLEFGRRLAQGREIVNLDFIKASAYTMPFADHSFDVVFSHALLDHLTDPERAMREFRRVTRPGGFIGICSPDWEAFELSPLPMNVGRAISAYRDLQEHHGGNTRAGARLCDWLKRAGFTPLACDEWQETHADPASVADDLAIQLETAGQFHHALALREWGQDPDARFVQSWKFATAVRADGHRLPPSILE